MRCNDCLLLLLLGAAVAIFACAIVACTIVACTIVAFTMFKFTIVAFTIFTFIIFSVYYYYIYYTCIYCYFTQVCWYFPLKEQLKALLQIGNYRTLLLYERQHRHMRRPDDNMCDLYDSPRWQTRASRGESVS